MDLGKAVYVTIGFAISKIKDTLAWLGAQK